MGAVAAVQRVGALTLGFLRGLAEVFALLYGAAVVFAFTRARGLGVVLRVGITQTLFTGVHALPLVGLATLALGTLIITQANAYLPAEYASRTAANIIAGDVVPLMVGIVIIGRSGTAICVELAGMRLSGELDALRAMGLTFEHYVVLPRLVAGMLSAVLLTVYGLSIGLAGGYALSKALGSLPFALEALLGAIDEHEVVEALAKGCLFGAGVVLVSLREGVSVSVSTREIPQATTRAVVRCLGLLVVLNSAISIFFA